MSAEPPTSATEPIGAIASAGTRFTRSAMLGMCVSFVVIGAVQAMYGPAVPAIRDRFNISSGAVGLALSVHFVGALLGVLFTPRMRRWTGNRAFLVVALSTIAAGSVVFAVAPLWSAALVAAFVVGVGFGWIDVGVNELFLEFYGSNSTGALNLLHGNFGLGAVLGPLLVGVLPGRQYPWAFVLCAVLAMLVLLTVNGVSGHPGTPATGDARWAAASRLTGLFMIFFVLHVGVETGVGGWETSHLVSLGWGATSAAVAASSFWLAMTAVRFAISPVARYFTAQQILLTCILVMLAGTLLAHWKIAAPIGYFIAGAGVGPLFPTGLVWLTHKLPAVPGITSYVIAVSMLGGVLPSFVGGAVEQWGPGVIPTALSVVGAACLIAALAIKSRTPLSGQYERIPVPDSTPSDTGAEINPER